MFKVSRKSEYALIAIQYMSRQPREALVTVAELSADESIPQDVLAKVMQTLKRAGILDASKGVGGGYRLARPLEEIAFLDVLRPFEEQIGVAPCHATGETCGRTLACSLRGPMTVLNAYVMRQFEVLTMDMFCSAHGLPIPPPRSGNARPLVAARRDPTPPQLLADEASPPRAPAAPATALRDATPQLSRE